MGRAFRPELLAEVEVRSLKWRDRWRARTSIYRELSERYVPGEGGLDQDGNGPSVMVIGEAPGATEDLKLRPFVGASGLVLRDLMASAGLFTGFTPHFGACNTWLTNTVKFRPPGNRTPDFDMVMSVRKDLRLEWLAVGAPDIVVAVGGVALLAALGHKASILALAGKPKLIQGSMGASTLWPMVHPAAGLRNPDIRPILERDWLRLGEWLRGTNR